MRLMRFVSAAGAAGVLSLVLVGGASADTSLSTTGPNSANTVTENNNTSVTETNTNNVQIVNVNEQQASTGAVAAKNNTSVAGGLGSGNATNGQTTTTTVSIGNASAGPIVGAPGAGAGNPGQPGVGAGTTGNAGSSATTAGKGGEVLGASTAPGKGSGTPAVLPATGALVPVDVSGIEKAWQKLNAPVPSSTSQDNSISTAMLGIAALLAVGGAALNTVYTRRRKAVQ